MSNIFSRLLNNSKKQVPQKKKVFINTPTHTPNKALEQQKEIQVKHAAEVQKVEKEKNQEKKLVALTEAKEKEAAIHAKNMAVFEKIYNLLEIPKAVEDRLLELKEDPAELFLFYIFHMKEIDQLTDDSYLNSLSAFIDVKYAKSYTTEKIKETVVDKFLFLLNVELTEGPIRSSINLSFFNNITLKSHLIIPGTTYGLWNLYSFLNPSITEQDRGIYQVYFSTLYTLHLNHENKIFYTNYFSKVNDRTHEEIECNFEKLRIATEQLTNEEKNIIRNFVNGIPKEFMLDPYLYRHFEYYIATYSFGESIVESSFNDREIHVVWYHLNNEETKKAAKSLKEDYFDKLLQIVKKKICIEEKLLPALIWLEFKKQVKEIYTAEWIKEYGIYFENSGVDMDELLYAYCNINEIDATGNQNIGYLTYYLMNLGLFDDNTQFLANHERLSIKIEEMKEQKNLVAFEQKLMQTSDSKKQSVKFNDLDLMTGEEFEYAIAELFKRMGYLTAITKASGDQGIDIIVEKGGRQFGIQAKCYGTKVSNTAVQEAAAGIVYHNCDRGVVVTNNYFTPSAIELASKNNIVLWDRDMLKEKFEEFLDIVT